MKQILAIVKPYLAERVVKAIADLPVGEVIVREAKGFGRQKDYVELYRNNEFSSVFVAKVEISVLVEDEHCDGVISAIEQASKTGRLGDGKIMVLSVFDVRSS